MDDQGRQSPAALFAGDLSDPWVADLAASLPTGSLRIDCPGELPTAWPEQRQATPVLVLHRAILDSTDADRLRSARRAGVFERLILCLGPHARYYQVQRWAPLVATILPEATAAEVLPRYLSNGLPGGSLPRLTGRLVVVSANRSVREVIELTARACGCEVFAAAEWSEAPAAPCAVWDIPVLEPRWSDRLADQAAHRRIVALLGLPDRELVMQARRAGAAACLELPCDPADLAFVLQRIARGDRATAMAGQGCRP